MGKQSAPTPPDFMGAASLQGRLGQQNVREATIANRPNISTPFGSQMWTQTPIGGGGAGGKFGGPAGGPMGETASGPQQVAGLQQGPPPAFGRGQTYQGQSPIGGDGGKSGNTAGSAGFQPSQWTMNNQLSAPLGAANENIQNQIATQSGTPLPSGEESRRAATEGVSALGRARLDPIWQQREAALN